MPTAVPTMLGNAQSSPASARVIAATTATPPTRASARQPTTGRRSSRSADADRECRDQDAEHDEQHELVVRAEQGDDEVLHPAGHEVDDEGADREERRTRRGDERCDGFGRPEGGDGCDDAGRAGEQGTTARLHGRHATRARWTFLPEPALEG
jgi:hypothetical protein